MPTQPDAASSPKKRLSLHAPARVTPLAPLALLAALCALAFAPEARAGSRPAQACRPLVDAPGPHGLWLGHFTGGRMAPVASGVAVEWRDDYACFASAAACAAWRRGLREVYRDVEGWGTCLALRGGGDYPRVERVVRRTVVKARY